MEEGLVVQGATLPVLSGDQMVGAFQQYQDLQRKLDASMPEQLMQIGDKKFRKKGYWRAIRVAFNLSVEPMEERREVSGAFDDGRENVGYVVTYRATGPNGSSATGDGACFAIEKAAKFRCPHPQKDNPNRTEHWPAENCPDYAKYNPWARLSPQATEHNIRSHAHTRAMNRAISNLVGFGEVSAEEVERDEHATETTKSAGSGSTAAASKPQVSADGSTKVKSVTPKPAEKKPGTVAFEDGRQGTTFDDKLLETATQAKAEGWSVVPKFETKPGKPGKPDFVNVVAIERVVVQEPALPLEDTEPVGQPEKVLFAQHVTPEGKSAYWKIQTDKRLYVTNVEGHHLVAKDAKADDKKVVVDFAPTPTANGLHNIVTKIAAVA